jgi:serralysin
VVERGRTRQFRSESEHATLTGRGGADTFVFNTALNATANVDRITDFDRLVDSIRLDMSVFKALTTIGVLSDNAFFVGPAAHDADDRIIYNQSTGALTYDSNGSAAGEPQRSPLSRRT